jgi:2-keto-3-deoxy-6-phosphogluconate aldolase
MGSKLISKEIVKNQDFKKLENSVRQALAIIQKVRTT